MSDNPLSKGFKSKCRRGARAKKKNAESTVDDVSKLFGLVLNLSSEPQTRRPRRPKIPKDQNDFISENFGIHKMVVGSNDLKISRNKVNKLKKKENNHTVQHCEESFVQIQETISVQNQGIDTIEIPEIVSIEQISVQVNQNVISPQEQEDIPQSRRKRRLRTKKKKDKVTTDIICEESSSVYVEDTENAIVDVVTVKKHSTKTFTRSKNETKSKSENETEEGSRLEKKKKKFENEKFPPTLQKEKVRKLLEQQPIDNPTYVEGNLRINIKYYKHAYLAMPGSEMDILIVGTRDRNRAMEGDLVVACINPEDKWFKHSSEKMQKTGVIVCILEKVHSRKTIGLIKKQQKELIFYPRDSRVPLLKINNAQLPFHQNPDEYKDILFLADITHWEKPKHAFGKIQQAIGYTGDLRAETNAILLDNNLDIDPFEEKLLQGLPSIDYILTENDLEGREDWRNCCIFTIDPATAVDLDDAVSCKILENGNYEISVHISDVTHFLKAFTPLDKKVSERATTVYLVDNVYHMLPKQLCQICSLLPGQDRLAFSVIWEMTPTAEIINHRFAKTVINSCCQMAYGQAQEMIENPLNDWSKESSIKVKGNFKASHLCETIQILYKLSSQMRERRFSTGALRIDNPKLHISLDRETGLPITCSIEEQKESNRLIEEFMLLANMTVAKQLYDTFPRTALLRSHREPSIRVLTQTRDMLEKFGVILNIESAGTLQMSLSRYESEVISESTENFAAKCRMMVINSLCAKSMTRAVYRCSNSIKEENDLRHYALNVPLYTHFTSPIRRYSDCIVHRLLYASISKDSLPPKWNSFLCTKLAANCNVKKYSAKVAQEQSSELFFAYLLVLRGPTNTQAVVMDVKNRSIDVILIDVGLKVRIYFADMEKEATAEFSVEHSVPTIKITWKESGFKQVMNVFSIVDVRIQKHPTFFRLHGVFLPPSSNIMCEALEEVKQSSQEEN